MDLFHAVFFAVFAGNILTAIFIWGVGRANQLKEDKDITSPILWAILGPLVVFVGAFIAGGAKLPLLGALISQ